MELDTTIDHITAVATVSIYLKPNKFNDEYQHCGHVKINSQPPKQIAIKSTKYITAQHGKYLKNNPLKSS